MNGKRDESGIAKVASITLDLILVLLLFAGALGVRWLYARAVVFPPLDDPAFYLTTAENVVTGRGLEVDVLWSYQPPFPNVTHPSHEHWMPLTTGLIAAAFAIQRAISGALETALSTGQLPGLLLGAALASLTYIVGRRILPGNRHNRWIALAAALLVAINATLSYQSASADSSAPFAFLVAWALALAVRQPGDQGSYFGVGLLIGLAYLTRADGLLLLAAVPLAWWLLPAPARPLVELPDSVAAQTAWDLWPRERGSEEEWARALGPSLSNLLDLGVAFALVLAPWLARNFLAFGTPLPSSVLSQARLTDYVDTFNYWDHPTWQTWLEQGWQTLLTQRGEALLHNGGVFLWSTFIWGLLALPGLWLLRREWNFFAVLIYGLLLFFGIALVFPVSTMSGTFYHSIGALMPFLALAAMYAIQRGLQRLLKNRKLATVTLAAVTIGLLVLAGAQVFQSLSAVTERHQAEKQQFEMIATWLDQHAAPGDVVMTTQTYTLNYSSGHPSIALPGNEPPDAAWEAAQRYRARYLVITQDFGLYPRVLHEQPDSRFRLVMENGQTEIYEIGGGQP
jgi:hypothetical protein